MPDSRFAPCIEYATPFLVWWGLLLFCCKLGSRRQLDFELRDASTQVLANVNRLAGTRQATLPVHDTLEHFVRHVGAAPFAALRTRMIRRLLRMKALDAARLHGHVVVAIDGTGHLHFQHRHCAHCLVRRHGTTMDYFHMVQEAKVVGPGGVALSMGTAFIENADVPPVGSAEAERWKQDGELKAFRRLIGALKQAYPQTAVCVTSDALYACAPAIRLVEGQGWAYVFTFKPGHRVAWREFQALLALCPEQTLRVTLPEGTRQVYRWASDVPVEDHAHRPYRVNAVQCEETCEGKTTTFAWMTNLPVTRETVVPIAMKGGRRRWTIENQGFNVQKNSELRLEHAYSHDPEGLKAYYYLLQIAHIMLQLLEQGSLLRRLAAAQGTQPLTLFGSLKNIARRLLEDLRHTLLPEEPPMAIQIRFDTS